ncbi:uncharacterized protein LOC136039595 [Artemia franciscana]|uniref:PHD-type domain-containing protein n=1 Tax=Artemia franciscana TaxID=6661 RepID=A0AA88I7D7_ARTSF|nr:hypothetical protein QYM36_006992 [Artemia franciscana]
MFSSKRSLFENRFQRGHHEGWQQPFVKKKSSFKKNFSSDDFLSSSQPLSQSLLSNREDVASPDFLGSQLGGSQSTPDIHLSTSSQSSQNKAPGRAHDKLRKQSQVVDYLSKWSQSSMSQRIEQSSQSQIVEIKKPALVMKEQVSATKEINENLNFILKVISDLPEVLSKAFVLMRQDINEDLEAVREEGVKDLREATLYTIEKLHNSGSANKDELIAHFNSLRTECRTESILKKIDDISTTIEDIRKDTAEWKKIEEKIPLKEIENIRSELKELYRVNMVQDATLQGLNREIVSIKNEAPLATQQLSELIINSKDHVENLLNSHSKNFQETLLKTEEKCLSDVISMVNVIVTEVQASTLLANVVDEKVALVRQEVEEYKEERAEENGALVPAVTEAVEKLVSGFDIVNRMGVIKKDIESAFDCILDQQQDFVKTAVRDLKKVEEKVRCVSDEQWNKMSKLEELIENVSKSNMAQNEEPKQCLCYDQIEALLKENQDKAPHQPLILQNAEIQTSSTFTCDKATITDIDLVQVLEKTVDQPIHNDICNERYACENDEKTLESQKGKPTRRKSKKAAAMYKMHYIDETFCEICIRIDDEETMLLCDSCNDGYHIGCLQPPLKTVPSTNWFCSTCINKKKRKSSRKTEKAVKSPVKPKNKRGRPKKAESSAKTASNVLINESNSQMPFGKQAPVFTPKILDFSQATQNRYLASLNASTAAANESQEYCQSSFIDPDCTYPLATEESQAEKSKERVQPKTPLAAKELEVTIIQGKSPHSSVITVYNENHEVLMSKELPEAPLEINIPKKLIGEILKSFPQLVLEHSNVQLKIVRKYMDQTNKKMKTKVSKVVLNASTTDTPPVKTESPSYTPEASTIPEAQRTIRPVVGWNSQNPKKSCVSAFDTPRNVRTFRYNPYPEKIPTNLNPEPVVRFTRNVPITAKSGFTTESRVLPVSNVTLIKVPITQQQIHQMHSNPSQSVSQFGIQVCPGPSTPSYSSKKSQSFEKDPYEFPENIEPALSNCGSSRSKESLSDISNSVVKERMKLRKFFLSRNRY